MAKKTLTFALEKETPGAIRYLEVDKNGDKAKPFMVGTLYLRKDQVDGTPAKVTVTVEY